MKTKYKGWLEERCAIDKEAIKRYARNYKVRYEFWEILLHTYFQVDGEKESDTEVDFDKNDEPAFEDIARQCLNRNDDFGVADISYHSDNNDGSGFYIKIENDSRGRGVFTGFRFSFSLSKKQVIDYIECEKQHFNECKLAFDNFDKNIEEITASLDNIISEYQKIRNICENNKTPSSLFDTIFFIKDVLEQHAE